MPDIFAMTPEEINEINEGLWKELDDAKEKSGYNDYWKNKKSSGGFTFAGWLLHIRRAYEKSIKA